MSVEQISFLSIGVVYISFLSCKRRPAGVRRELTGLEQLGFWKARTTGASTQEALNVFREKDVRVYMQVCTLPGTSKTRRLCAWDSER